MIAMEKFILSEVVEVNDKPYIINDLDQPVNIDW